MGDENRLGDENCPFAIVRGDFGHGSEVYCGASVRPMQSGDYICDASCYEGDYDDATTGCSWFYLQKDIDWAHKVNSGGKQ